MPTYEYECCKCNNKFEVFQKMSEEPLSKCPECGGKVKRLISGGAGINFKGSGFYLKDSAAKPSSGNSSAESKTSSGCSACSSSSCAGCKK